MPFDSSTMRRTASTRRKSKRSGASAALPPVNETEAVQADLEAILPGMSVAEIVELVQSDMADLADVIAAESVGKARKTVLSLVQSESGKVYPVSKISVTESNPFA